MIAIEDYFKANPSVSLCLTNREDDLIRLDYIQNVHYPDGWWQVHCNNPIYTIYFGNSFEKANKKFLAERS